MGSSQNTVVGTEPASSEVQFNNPQIIMKRKEPVTQCSAIINKFHREILQNPAFVNCGPSIVDNVFSLTEYTKRSDDVSMRLTTNEELKSQEVYLSYEECKDGKYSSSEFCLVVLNIFLFVGIMLTILSSVLVYLVVNKEPRS